MSVIPSLRAVSARTAASFSRTKRGRRSSSPIAFSRMPFSIISARSASRNSARSVMSAPTSSSGRDQFSLEKA